VALLKKKVRRQELDDSDDAADLVAAHEKMPLAIVQAAAYISNMSPGCSVRTYLTKFKKSEHRHAISTMTLPNTMLECVVTGRQKTQSFAPGRSRSSI
jgi:hypothetical protein